MRHFLLVFSFLLWCQSGQSAPALSTEAFLKPPKLIVLIVIDQFRPDLLNDPKLQLRPAGTMKKPGGFRFLMQHGAWFPFAEYNVAQAMTCPGHAIIATGASPALSGITGNDWIDPTTKKKIYCVQDDQDRFSPRRLRANTLGDELRNRDEKSKVISIALKDRSAIMMGGHRATQTIWFEAGPKHWTSSSFYPSPAPWVQAENEELKKSKEPLDLTSKTLDASLRGTKSTFRLAARALKAESLGQGSSPDLFAIGLSNHDILGHALGPYSAEMRDLIQAEDRELENFFRLLSSRTQGLKDVVIVLTADHGIPPLPEESKKNRLGGGTFEHLPAIRKINERLDEKFGKPGKEPWVLHSLYLQFHLNEDLIRKKKLAIGEVEREAKEALLEMPGVLTVQTRSDFKKGHFPPGLLGRQIQNSFHPRQSGHLMTILQPFMIEKTGNAVTHMTGWSYDRVVPLFFVGARFQPGVYTDANIQDIAPTLSFVMGTLPPSMSEGRVLKEALKSR